MDPKSTPAQRFTHDYSVELSKGQVHKRRTPLLVFAAVLLGAVGLTAVVGFLSNRAEEQFGTPKVDIAKLPEEGGRLEFIPPNPAVDEPIVEGGSAEDRQLFRDVMSRLLQTKEVRSSFPAVFAWPPESFIVPNSTTEFNAFVRAVGKDRGSNKFLVRAVITEGYMNKIVDGSDDVLAAIMGHELAHITKGHLGNQITPDLLSLSISRDQEIEADLEGVKIAVAAGFPFRSGVRSAFREWKALGDYSNFEGIKATHPSWTERLALLDRGQAQLWQAMAAFQNGYFFLHAEQYAAAEKCFQQVVDDFPDCGEAWANLGYARLMQYCDSLDEADVRKLNLGQFVAGCFYAQPKDLAPVVRGDRKKWEQAVSTLTTALRRHPNLTLIRANLGLAYLVHPEGKKTDEALAHFSQALQAKNDSVDGLGKAALLVNYGVAELAAGKNAAAAEMFRLANQALPSARPSPLSSQLGLALLYNEATIEAQGGNQARAFSAYEIYVGVANPDSAWWKLAYEQYARLGAALGKKVATREQLTTKVGNRFLRMVTSVEAAPGKLVTLSDSTPQVLKTLDREHMAGIPVYHRSTIKRYHAVSPGVDVLARDIVLAVFLTSPEAPPIYVQAEGIGTAKVALRVGMPVQQLREALKDQLEQEGSMVVDPAVRYVFLPYLGLAYHVQGDRVAEIVMAQVARKPGN